MAVPKGTRIGGRQKGTLNKATASVKEMASKFGPEAVATLADIMKNGETEPARIAAAKELLDRAYGKAPQAFTGENGEGPIEFLVGWLSNGS